jgi:hypothetical protein
MHDDFAHDLANIVFKVPVGRAIEPTGWSLSPDAPVPELDWEGDGADLELVARDGERKSRRWTLPDPERIFHPVRFAVGGRGALLVPIEQPWADTLLEYGGQPRTLDHQQMSEKLLLRADNAYYC